MGETFQVEIYFEGDDTLPEVPDELHTFDRLEMAVLHALGEALTSWEIDHLDIWTHPDRVGKNAIAFYDTGHPGNIVVRRVDNG